MAAAILKSRFWAEKIVHGNIGGQNFKDEIYISNDFT